MYKQFIDCRRLNKDAKCRVQDFVKVNETISSAQVMALSINWLFQASDCIANFGCLFIILAFDCFFHLAAKLDQFSLGIGRNRDSVRTLSNMIDAVVDVR